MVMMITVIIIIRYAAKQPQHSRGGASGRDSSRDEDPLIMIPMHREREREGVRQREVTSGIACDDGERSKCGKTYSP